MLRAVLADLHVGQGPGDLERFVSSVSEVRRRGADEVVFLGDLFRALVGFSRFWDETVRRGLEELAALRRGGARVVLVEGNRDFFLDAADLDPYRDAGGPVHSFVAGGKRFLLEHGDLINRADRSYRFWRAVSKSGPARLWARLLPRRLAQRIVLGTESRLKETNFSYRRDLPAADLAAAARRHFAAGVDVVLWGHFHRSWVLTEGGREARVVPAWLETGAVVWIADDGALAIVEG
ncbi:MAG TPA: metallophosphoesterase [Thermoanaerobaculaceae bacterium]|nr:metallophosphoesterase [Thermoanaerobaculaceae bacterium]